MCLYVYNNSQNDGNLYISHHQLHTSGKHIVAVSLPLWGHTKSLCAFVARVVQLHHVHVTLLTDVATREKALNEATRLLENEDDMKHLIRVVALPSPLLPFQFDFYMSSFIEAYRALYSGSPLPITPDNDAKYEPVSVPQLVVMDFFGYEMLKGIRSISGTQVPVYAWQSGSATACLYLFGPENLGGSGDIAEKLSKITVEDPKEREKEIEKIVHRSDQKLVELPGLPPMYEYEHIAQIAAFPFGIDKIASVLQYQHRFLVECDGVLHCTSTLFEGESVKKWREWYSSRPVFAIGPISPPASAEDIEREKSKSPIGEEVTAFLNHALDKHGPNSVVYVSFGTTWWPAQPGKIWTFIDVLIEQGIPFLFSHPSPFANVPEEISSKVKASGLGYMAKWLPQQIILRHKACGWFVSHCGHNSVLESLTAGVPLICWPYETDQPTNAANVTFVHGVGYELFEVRTGDGLRPIHRLGDKAPTGTVEAIREEALDLLSKARGKDGEVKRTKAQWFSEQFSNSWEEGGEARSELNRFVDVLD